RARQRAGEPARGRHGPHFRGRHGQPRDRFDHRRLARAAAADRVPAEPGRAGRSLAPTREENRPMAAAKTFDGLPAEKWIDLYTIMMRIRQFEERIMPLLKEGKIKGTAHPSVGQEAVAAGVCGVLEPTDYIVSNHRGHGHCIAKGMKTTEMMAELYAKRTGSNKGKGGSMHIADLDQYIIGCTGIVGSGAPIAGGAALAAKMRKTGQVVICFFGDGGINQGVVFEAMNMAAIWQLPVIFVCENNM